MTVFYVLFDLKDFLLLMLYYKYYKYFIITMKSIVQCNSSAMHAGATSCIILSPTQNSSLRVHWRATTRGWLVSKSITVRVLQVVPLKLYTMHCTLTQIAWCGYIGAAEVPYSGKLSQIGENTIFEDCSLLPRPKFRGENFRESSVFTINVNRADQSEYSMTSIIHSLVYAAPPPTDPTQISAHDL